MTDDSLDTLVDGKLQLYQSRTGYRFSLDALLLANFVTVRVRDRVADLGAGNGPIALLLSHLHAAASISAIEVQPAMVARLRRSVALNQLAQRITVIGADLRRVDGLLTPLSFDVVVCNPPFRKASSGRVSADRERQIARHEIKGSLADFLAAAKYLLRPKGRLALIYGAERAVDLIAGLRAAGIEPKRLRWVHSFATDGALMLLVEAVLGGRSGVAVAPPLVIYRSGKQYSAEVAAIVSNLAKPDPSR